MPKYLLLLRGDPAEYAQCSPEQLQQLIQKFEGWAAKLAAEGRFLDGKKLTDGEGRVIATSGRDVSATDGPYGETKELVGGIHLIEADSYDHAVELCRDHPNLELNGSVEIRELDFMGQPEE